MFPETATILKEQLGKWPSPSIINLGSGTRDYWAIQQPYIYSEVFRPALDRQGPVINVDPKPDPDARSFGITHYQSDASAVPLEPAVADVVLCMSLFEHTDNHEAILAECRRLLIVPHGRAFFEVPDDYPYHPDPVDTGLRIGKETEWEAFLGATWQIKRFWPIASRTRPGTCSMVEAAPAFPQ